MPTQLVVCVCVQDSVYVKFVSETAAGQGCRALHGWTCDGMNSAISRCKSYIPSFRLTSMYFSCLLQVLVCNDLCRET